MEWWSSVVGALIGLIGVFVGSVMNYFLMRRQIALSAKATRDLERKCRQVEEGAEARVKLSALRDQFVQSKELLELPDAQEGNLWFPIALADINLTAALRVMPADLHRKV